MSDKIAGIRERHKDSDNNFIEYETIRDIHADRAFLLAEDERHRAEIERLTGKLKLVADALNETISKYHEVGDQNDRLDAENERLRDALHEALSGLRYWVPQTARGLVERNRIMQRVEEALEGKP